MEYRKFGKLDFSVSEIGYGMWGLAGWKGHDDNEVSKSLDLAIERGVSFFDTAWGYGEGESERILGHILTKHQKKELHFATKIPPKNWKWPSKPEYSLADCFPFDHIVEYTEKSLKNIGTECIEVQQFHTWEDGWAENEDWKKAVEKLKKEGKVKSFGISANRWEPENCIKAIETGLIDSIQVIYNIFDQAPEDKLFKICKERNIAVIARVPFDEGTLTGILTKDTVFEADDWRSTYFVPENLIPSVERADELKKIVPAEMTMAEMALRFILSNPDITTAIPGMRREKNVLANTATSDGKGLPKQLIDALRSHRWDRQPTSWSQ
jgi:aryl-alcohol dehydrogenase-like predicted oxidoreductase